MEEDDSLPGGSGTKEIGDKKAASSPPRIVSGPDNDSDEEWEDQDTDEEDKLTIDEPPTKKIKFDAIQDTKGGIPENIVNECKKFISLDRKLDKKAKRNNMNTKQVKLVLKHIFSSPQLLAMLRDQGLLTNFLKETENIPAAEPKMTRSMARTLTEAGDACPWILNPKTPMKEPAPEIVSLVTEEFPDEEGDDPEYTPDLEPRLSDDEDSFMMSETSEAGTPFTNTTRSTVNTPRSELGTPSEFRRPGTCTPRPSSQASPRTKLVSRHLQFDQQETWEGYGTRSKRPLTEMNIEDIEQQFVPFDITPDMYDIPCDNDDYSEFLKTLYSGSCNKQSVKDGCPVDDDLADPEYSFPPDEEDLRLKDPEELRDDRATKISRKELADLMAELLECANEANSQDSDKESKKKVKLKKKRSTVHNPPPPPVPNTQHDSPHRDQPSVENKSPGGEKKLEEEGRQEENPFNPFLRNQLAVQVQQHIQLLTQMRLLASHNSSFTEVRLQCDQMLQQLHTKSINQPYSVLNQCNMQPSLEAVEEWEVRGEDPVVIQSNRRESSEKKRFKYVLKPQFVEFVCTRAIICFPRLLPGSGLIRLHKRVVWTDTEDLLLAQGLEWISTQSRWVKGNLSKTNLRDLSMTLHTKFMPAKSSEQIHIRMKNLRRNYSIENGEELNPVQLCFKTGCAPAVPPCVEQPVINPPTLSQLVLAGQRNDIPDTYVQWVLQPIIKKLSQRPTKIEAKEVVLVEPDIPDLDSEPSCSDEGSSDEGPESRVKLRRKPLPKKRVPILPKPTRKRTGPALLLPRTSAHLPRLLCETLDLRTPLRPLLCVVGNETPVRLSESDTPPLSTATQTTPSPAKSTATASSAAVRSPVKTPTKLSFRSPVRYFKSPLKSPFKSPLKSLNSMFSRSPLKAASDRIIRKYGSPLKRQGRTSRRLGRHSLTPKRLLVGLVDKTDGRSPRTPPCRNSPLTSPREGETDTPTAVGRRKSRIQREAEVTLSLLGPLETEEERDAREARETQEMYTSIQAIIAGNQELELRYEEIISGVPESGVRETFVKLHQLVDGHPDVQEMLLDLLTEEDAASLGRDIYNAHSDRLRLKRFLLKMGIVYKHQPAYHTKVLKELEMLAKDSSLTSEGLKTIGCRLFRTNQHLLDEFLMLIPGIKPPDSMLPSPEILHIPEDTEDWEGLEIETVPVPRSPASEGNTGSVRFTSAGCFVLDGKNLKPARVEKVPSKIFFSFQE